MQLRSVFSLIALFVLAVGCTQGNRSQGISTEEGRAVATFAGGCFWCMEPPFEKLNGVESVISGYTGGTKKNPTYEEVSSGTTKHRESIQITYDPAEVSYSQLLDVFWRNIDPTDAGGQFADRGSQYKSAIFYHDSDQKEIAERSEADLQNSGVFDRPIVTEILKASAFYPAEDYHQDYYKKNYESYKSYRRASGREAFLDSVWKDEPSTQDRGSQKPSDTELRESLTPLEYHVTQEDGTEPAFDNTYWNNKDDGIYVDIVSGEVLFSSKDKFASGTGWPSFTRPLEPENIAEQVDTSLGTVRSEVRSKHADSHLGHVFSDGPEPTGLRYCINSAALRFIPKEQLEEEGYGEYLSLFDE